MDGRIVSFDALIEDLRAILGERLTTSGVVRDHHGEDEKDPLDDIIKTFNERFFAGWDATPEEQRVKFINIARHVVDNPDYAAQVVNNQDEQNRQIALEKMIQQAIGAERKRELDLYKRYANDPEFKRAFNASIGRFLQNAALSQYFEDVAGCQPAPVPDTERSPE